MYMHPSLPSFFPIFFSIQHEIFFTQKKNGNHHNQHSSKIFFFSEYWGCAGVVSDLKWDF